MNKQSPYKKLYRRWLILQARNKREQIIGLNKKMEMHIQWMAILFFVGIIAIAIIGIPTLLSWIQISRIYIIWAIIFSLIPHRMLPKIYSVRKELKILLAVCALAPVFTALVLVLNFAVVLNVSDEKYKVESYNVYYSDHLIEVNLENNIFENQTEIRRFSTDKFPFEPDSASYRIKTGLFGFKVATHPRLIELKND
ncbi:MAG: hypothetical protein WCX31_08265 [Salinivirgaceae bacterium]